MNARTAKLISRVAASRAESKELKRLWNLTPRPARRRVRGILERILLDSRTEASKYVENYNVQRGGE